MYTDKDRHAFVHTEKATTKDHNTGKARQVGRDKGKAGQSERDTLRVWQEDGYEDKTQREDLDAVSRRKAENGKEWS